MDRGASKPPLFDGKNYAHWKIRMCAYLQGIDSKVWEICENAQYRVLATRTTPEQKEQHEANCKARNALYAALFPTEFDRISDLPTAREIWLKLKSFYEGTE